MDMIIEGWHPCLQNDIFRMMKTPSMMMMMNLLKVKKGIIDIGGITITNDSEILTDDVEGSNEIPSLNVERTLVHLCFLMQNVINECKQEGVALCDHAISYL